LRKLVVTENITSDGVIDQAKGCFRPVDDAEDPEMVAALGQQSARSDALVVGRETFEQMRGFWPQQHEDTTGVAAHLNSVSKYVFSRTLKDPQWEGTSILTGDVADEVAKLKSMPGEDIVVTGSITLVQELVTLDLPDEYRLFVYPVVVGGGRRLFEADDRLRPLELLEATSFKSGVVLLRYAPTR
jgi:dihydrofolate reductase